MSEEERAPDALEKVDARIESPEEITAEGLMELLRAIRNRRYTVIPLNLPEEAYTVRVANGYDVLYAEPYSLTVPGTFQFKVMCRILALKVGESITTTNTKFERIK